MVTGPGSISDVVNAQLARNQFNAQDSIALITKRLVERNREDRADVAINFDRADFVRASKEIARMANFKNKVADNVNAASKARDALEWTKRYLGEAKTGLNQILGSSSNSDRAAAAADFDGLINNINSKVNDANVLVDGYQNVNLVGNTTGPDWKTDTIYTPTSDKGAGFAVVEGAFLGVDFQVTDSDGMNWRLNDSESTLYQYRNDGSGERTGRSISTDGLTIDSYDASTGAVTYGGSGSLTGTLTRAGLGLLKSEYYNSLTNDISVQSAIDDIDAALNTLSAKGASIIADASLLEGRIDLINSKIENLEDEKDRIRSEELDASGAESAAADLKLRLALDNINLLSNINNGLVENMLSLSSGPSPAQGVFGIFGY